jgi:hypothetical protein
MSIKILSTDIQKDGNLSILSVKLFLDNKECILYYKFSSKYVNYLSYEVADAYIVALLIYAMERGVNIESEIPVSEKLLFSLNKFLIPFLCKINKKLMPIQIKAKSSTFKCSGEHVGTGISCGVDSLSTIIYHGIEEQCNHYKVDTLCLINSGYYGLNNNDNSFYKESKKSKSFCSENDFDFLMIDTNLYDLTQYKSFHSVHTYLTCSTILLFQKYFRIYYYASGFPVHNFKASFDDSANYDTFLLNNISTDSLQFYSSCCIMSRVEKTALISKHPQIYNNLYVCTNGKLSYNCGYCEKCIRTMLAFDSLGLSDMIERRFDIKQFKKNRYIYIGFMLRKKRKNIFYNEIYKSYKDNKIKIPFACYILCIVPCYFERMQILSQFAKTKLGNFLRKCKYIVLKK